MTVEKKTLEVDDLAPDFKIKNQNKEWVSLKDSKGKWVVLYFYPKDLTPGCTTEACDFTQFFPKFKQTNTVIYGVSPDSPELHRKFIEKESLTISLLSDEDKKVCEQYGVWQLKKLYGKEYLGVVRTTFLIDPKGKIVHIWKKVKVEGHVEDVLSTLKKLS